MPPGIAPVQGAESGRYFGWLEVDPATVGKPSSVRWRLAGDEQREKPPALLTLTITHLERGKTVFAVERLAAAGEFAMKFQFADGGTPKQSA